MHPVTVREPRRDEDVAPIHLRSLHRALQFRQIAVAQLEHSEPDPLETSLVGVDPERQVVRALREQQLGRSLTGRTVEEGVEPARRLVAEGNMSSDTE